MTNAVCEHKNCRTEEHTVGGEHSPHFNFSHQQGASASHFLSRTSLRGELDILRQ